MSDTQKSTPSSVAELDEDQVAAWLAAHPHFVSRHPEAFEAQVIGHDAQGAASLIERQVIRLRQTNKDLAARFNELVETAQANEERVVQLNRVARIMVGAADVDSMITALADSLKTHLAVDDVHVALEGSAQKSAGQKIKQITWLDEAPSVQDALTHVVRRGKPICGELAAKQAEALFAADSDALYTSAAFIPLGRSRVRGAIVLASRDPQRFTPDMGTLFIELFGALLTATLARLIGDDVVA